MTISWTLFGINQGLEPLPGNFETKERVGKDEISKEQIVVSYIEMDTPMWTKETTEGKGRRDRRLSKIKRIVVISDTFLYPCYLVQIKERDKEEKNLNWRKYVHVNFWSNVCNVTQMV